MILLVLEQIGAEEEKNTPIEDDDVFTTHETLGQTRNARVAK